MKWSKWWPRLAEIPALILAVLAVVLQILRNTKIWVAPIDPIDQNILLVALLVVSFFVLRQRFEGLEQSIDKLHSSDRIVPVARRSEVDQISARLLRDSLIPENEREILLVTFISPKITLDEKGKQTSHGRQLQTPLSQRIRDGWAVRRMIIVMNKKDLDFVVAQYINPFNDKKTINYEVRVIALLDTLPPIPLLVVGRERAIIGLYSTGVGTTMHGALVLYGSESTVLARNHFQSLWDRSNSYRLRPHETGKLDQAAYERICRDLGVIVPSAQGMTSHTA